MVKKSLKRFHIDYYLVIKFLINRFKKRFHIHIFIRDYYLVIKFLINTCHMVKKSLKRFHIRIRHYYYLVIKFL